MERLWKDIDGKIEVLWEKPISLPCNGPQIPLNPGISGGRWSTNHLKKKVNIFIVWWCTVCMNGIDMLFYSKMFLKYMVWICFLKSTGYGGFRLVNWELIATWYWTQCQLNEFINKMGTWRVGVSSLVPYLHVLWQLLFTAKCHTVYLTVASSLADCHWCWNLFIYYQIQISNLHAEYCTSLLLMCYILCKSILLFACGVNMHLPVLH
jgi:hypothetical protein